MEAVRSVTATIIMVVGGSVTLVLIGFATVGYWHPWAWEYVLSFVPPPLQIFGIAVAIFAITGSVAKKIGPPI